MKYNVPSLFNHSERDGFAPPGRHSRTLWRIEVARRLSGDELSEYIFARQPWLDFYTLIAGLAAGFSNQTI